MTGILRKNIFVTTSQQKNNSGMHNYNSLKIILRFQLRQVPSGGKSRNNLRRKSISSSSSSSTTTISSSTTFNQDSSTYSKDDHSDAIQYDYESRIAFIQKQHAKMLASLHQEMEELKRKNQGMYRTLQFHTG